MDNFPRVTDILKEAGLYDFSGIPAEILARACQFGTAVHRMTELDDLGTLDTATLDVSLTPYLMAWKRFKTDFEGYHAIAIEKAVKSQIWGYKGTPDRIALIKGAGYVIDIKSTAVISPVVALQMQAYKMAHDEMEGLKNSGLRRLCVQLKGDGTYMAQEFTDANDRNVCLSLLIAYKWKQKHNLLSKEKKTI